MNTTGQSSSLSKERKKRHRLYWPLVKKTKKSAIHHQFVNHLNPALLDRPSHYDYLLTGFKLLRKEPHNAAIKVSKKASDSFNAFIKDTSVTGVSEKHPRLLISNQSSQRFFLLDLSGSFLFHGTLIALLLFASRLTHPPFLNPYGNSKQGEPVDVVFLPRSTGQSGLKGEGYNGESAPSKAMAPPPVADLTPVTPVTPPVPTPNQTLSENETIEPQPNTEPIPTKQHKIQRKRKQNEFKQEHQYTYKNIPPRIHHQPSRIVKPRSPFENLTNLDFNENPNSSRRKTAKIRPQGSRSAINMSTGPLVKNGRINVPYADKFTIKGVSSDYSDLIANWIQQHMYYPPDAIRKGEDGSPSVHVVISRDGQVLSINLTNSSGSDALDSAILGMFRNAQLPKIPPDLPDHFDMDLKINYILLRQ